MHSLSKLVVLVVVSLGFTAFAQTPQPLAVDVGEKTSVIVTQLKRVAIGDSSIADVKTSGGDSVDVTGVQIGTTTLLIWTEGEEAPEKFAVTVSAASARPLVPSAPAVKTGRSLVGPTATLQVHESLIHDAKDIKRIAIADPRIADVNTTGGVLSVTGMSAGETTLILMMNDGSRKHFRLVVR